LIAYLLIKKASQTGRAKGFQPSRQTQTNKQKQAKTSRKAPQNKQSFSFVAYCCFAFVALLYVCVYMVVLVALFGACLCLALLNRK
jgi:Flp pilus assembly protein TadB